MLRENFVFLFREEINQYDFGEGHPFHGRRGEDFLKFFQEKTKKKLKVLKAEKATTDDLLLICDKDYIEFSEKYFNHSNVRPLIQQHFFQYHSADNFPRQGAGKIEEAARYIVGQIKMAADLVYSGKYQKVVSLGGGLHHAKRNYGEGFCIYNDVAFCGKYLIEKYNLKRILILDTDAHAGNGTMEYFYDEERVLFIDIHQDPSTLYPGTGFIDQIGENRGEGFTINIPLPPYASDLSYRLTFEEIIEPVVKKFKPEIVIRNGGSDPHFSDPLTNLGLTIQGFRMIGEKVRKLSEICQGKEIDLIASGYNLEKLYLYWTTLLSGILGIKLKIEPENYQEKKETILQTKKIIEEIKIKIKPYWKI